MSLNASPRTQNPEPKTENPTDPKLEVTMRAIWFITLFASSAWLYMLSTFTPAKLTLVVPFVSPLFLGVMAASLSFKHTPLHRLPMKAALFFLPLLLMRLFVPYPYSFGAMMMAVGLIIALTSNRFRHLAPLSCGFLLTGLILLVQGACMPIFYVIGSRYHEVKLLNQIAYPFVRLFGFDASMSEGIIYLPTFTNLIRFPGTLEKAGFHMLFLMIIAGLILLAMFGRSWKTLFKFFGICIGYTLLRYVMMIFIYAQLNDAVIYWDPISFTLSYLPLAGILCAAIPLKHPDAMNMALPIPDFRKKEGGLALLFFAGIFCLVGVWGFHDPGERKPGRLLIDEKHSNWEWSTRKFDTTWFGSQSTYNYYCMIDHFNHFYKVDQNTEEDLSRELLSEYDVLILKTPTEAYGADEIENVIEFVRNGGGLWLIGDHTNVFGMNYYLNFIAKRFGMFFHYDSTYDLAKGTLTVYKRPKIFPHPVVQNMPPFLFATSCTVDASLSAQNVMVGYGLRSRLLSYSDRSFFERKPTSDYEFGLFLQSSAATYGKGRVLTYTDSTCFSNFYMFIPGKPELALGSVEWLNRKNRYDVLSPLFGVIACILLFAGLYKGWEDKRKTLSILFFSALFATVAAIPFFTWLSQKSYAFPKPHTDFRTAAFEREYSHLTLPVEKLVDKHPYNYHTFYVWTQRMGYVPLLEKSLSDALEKGDMVVLVNPVKPFAEDDIQKIVRFVENGGRLLLLDGPQNKKSTSNPLLKPFEMEIDFSEIRQTDLYDSRTGETLCTAKRTGTVKGGRAMAVTRNRKSVFSVLSRGKGLVGVMADSYLFANPQMGGTQITPDKTREQIYRMEFYMLEHLR